MDLTVVGVDGCRGGWVVATMSATQPGSATVERVRDLVGVFAALEAGHFVRGGIDIPIGLPDRGSRRCDVEARRMIGTRRSSVFPAPPRGLLGAANYEEAASRSRAVQGKGISKQLFAILAKIAEVDRLMTIERQRYVAEVHPELCFTLLAGEPMGHHKATVEGRRERLEVLGAVVSNIDEIAETRLPGTRPDDVLDALVIGWSAARWSAGVHLQLGGDLDDRGLRMEILA